VGESVTYQRIVPQRDAPHICNLPTSFGDADPASLDAAVRLEQVGYIGQSSDQTATPVANPPSPGSGSIWACDYCGRRYRLTRENDQFSWANAG
jgi:hypothetical protein